MADVLLRLLYKRAISHRRGGALRRHPVKTEGIIARRKLQNVRAHVTAFVPTPENFVHLSTVYGASI